MKKYVLGFAFDDQDQVSLILKNRPEWQAGRYNGIGGKIEPGEEILQAMVREFQEETGLFVARDRWQYRGLCAGTGFQISVYMCVLSYSEIPSTTTDEVVGMLPMDWIRSSDRVLPHVATMIDLCRMTIGPNNVVPTFTLYY